MEAGKARLGDGCRIAYRVDGRRDAPALIFSNSLGCDMRMWDSQAAALAKNFRVLRYDARGHGASDRPAGAYSVDRLGRDVVELMDFLSIGEANFCGLSLGGMVGQWLGVRAPERLNKLVLANTAAYLGPPSSWDARIDLVRERGMAAIADAVIARWFTKTFLNESSDITDHWRGVLSSADSAGYAGCCAAIRDMDMRATAHLIKPRTLVIAGAQDEATPPDESKFIAERLYQGSLAQLNAAHLSNIECDEAFTGLIAEFFQNA